MKKDDEMTDPRSCLNKAAPDEILFVLLARDEASPYAIRAWICERIRRGLNKVDDPQILEADECQRKMEAQRHEREFLGEGGGP